MKIIKMRYSIEPRDTIYVKGYRFWSFAKNMVIHATKVAKSLSNKYSQKLLDSAKKSTMDAIKTASKTTIQKSAEAAGDLIGNKFADIITSVSKNSDAYIKVEEGIASWKDVNVPKKRYISPEERQQIIDELRLV